MLTSTAGRASARARDLRVPVDVLLDDAAVAEGELEAEPEVGLGPDVGVPVLAEVGADGGSEGGSEAEGSAVARLGAGALAVAVGSVGAVDGAATDGSGASARRGRTRADVSAARRPDRPDPGLRAREGAAERRRTDTGHPSAREPRVRRKPHTSHRLTGQYLESRPKRVVPASWPVHILRTGRLPTLPGVGSWRMRTGVVVATLLVTAGCGTAKASSPGSGLAPPSASPSASAPTAPVSPARSSPSPGSTLQVVGLGDSVTSGYHCDCDDYVTGFAHLLSQQDGVKVDATDDGEAGSTSDGLADELEGTDGDDRDLQDDVAGADVVVITMGANDLAPALDSFREGSCDASCYDPQVAQMQTDLGRVLDRVQALDHGHARVLVTTYWNVFTDGDVARAAERSGYLAWSDTVTRRANTAIATVASAHRATLVDLYAPFKGDGSADPTRLLADDGDHPDAAGTALISRAVLQAYEAHRTAP